MNYYDHHIGDYDSATAHLSWSEDTAYSRLIRMYYRTEKPIPSDVAQACRLVRAVSKSEKHAVVAVLNEFFTLEEDGWHQKRCDEEIARMHEKSSKARNSAAKRWKSEGNANASANAMRTHTEGNAPNNQYPITNSQEQEKTSPPNGGSSLWDFGVSLLADQGVKEATARNFIGSLCRDWDEHYVEEAIRAAVGKVNAQGYIRGVLKEKPKRGQNFSIV